MRLVLTSLVISGVDVTDLVADKTFDVPPGVDLNALARTLIEVRPSAEQVPYTFETTWTEQDA